VNQSQAFLPFLASGAALVSICVMHLVRSSQMKRRILARLAGASNGEIPVPEDFPTMILTAFACPELLALSARQPLERNNHQPRRSR
jgi:hypothetical protein